jgi:hypothetical protein
VSAAVDAGQPPRLSRSRPIARQGDAFGARTADRDAREPLPTGRAGRVVTGGRCGCGPGPHNWLDASPLITHCVACHATLAALPRPCPWSSALTTDPEWFAPAWLGSTRPRAWEAPSDRSVESDPTGRREHAPTLVVRWSGHGRGTAGEDEHGSGWQRWHHVGGRVRPLLGDACLVGKGCWPAAAVRWDSNPAPACFAGRGGSGGCRVTCDSRSPGVTARARPGPAVPGGVRTQCGPRGAGPRPVATPLTPRPSRDPQAIGRGGSRRPSARQAEVRCSIECERLTTAR